MNNSPATIISTCRREFLMGTALSLVLLMLVGCQTTAWVETEINQLPADNGITFAFAPDEYQREGLSEDQLESFVFDSVEVNPDDAPYIRCTRMLQSEFMDHGWIPRDPKEEDPMFLISVKFGVKTEGEGARTPSTVGRPVAVYDKSTMYTCYLKIWAYEPDPTAWNGKKAAYTRSIKCIGHEIESVLPELTEGLFREFPGEPDSMFLIQDIGAD